MMDFAEFMAKQRIEWREQIEPFIAEAWPPVVKALRLEAGLHGWSVASVDDGSCFLNLNVVPWKPGIKMTQAEIAQKLFDAYPEFAGCFPKSSVQLDGGRMQWVFHFFRDDLTRRVFIVNLIVMPTPL